MKAWGETVTAYLWRRERSQAQCGLFPLGLRFSTNAQDDRDGQGAPGGGPRRSRHSVQVLADGAWGWHWSFLKKQIRFLSFYVNWADTGGIRLFLSSLSTTYPEVVLRHQKAGGQKQGISNEIFFVWLLKFSFLFKTFPYISWLKK